LLEATAAQCESVVLNRIAMKGMWPELSGAWVEEMLEYDLLLVGGGFKG